MVPEVVFQQVTLARLLGASPGTETQRPPEASRTPAAGTAGKWSGAR